MLCKTIYLSIGSNLGDRKANLQLAYRGLEREGIRIRRRSSTYETQPQDVTGQPWFLNSVIECETTLLPLQLLRTVQRIERDLGRVRTGAVRRGPRVIDIDVLLFGRAVIRTPQLEVPHPRMIERRFVLQPLLEIAPDLRDPASREPFRTYLGQISGQRVRLVAEESARG